MPDVVLEAVLALRPSTAAVELRPSAAGTVFEQFAADRFRTALTRACRAAGVPAFSPHDLRHRRVSMLHAGGVS